jgi:TPR repeat protein
LGEHEKKNLPGLDILGCEFANTDYSQPLLRLQISSVYLMGTGMEQGVARNVERGEELLTKGAEGGSRQSAYILGSLYGKGELITKDLSKAFYFLTLAAMAKHDQAHRVLHIFQHTHKGNYVQEFDAAEDRYRIIQNMRRAYKCI